MVTDLTGMAVANASLLDEGTAAGEAMALLHRVQGKKLGDARGMFLVSDRCFPQTIAVLRSRAEPLGIELRDRPGDQMDVRRAGRVRRARAVSGRSRAARRSEAVHRQGARRRRARSRSPPICSRSRSRPRRARCRRRRRVRQLAALRRAARIRRPARGVLRHQPGIRAPHAGPRHRRVDRRAGPSRLSHGAADARAAHPPREGDLEHLHRAGAARQHGGDVRGVSRPRRHQGDRHARARDDARARRRAEGARLRAAATPATSTRCASTPTRRASTAIRDARDRRGLSTSATSATREIGIALDETVTIGDLLAMLDVFAPSAGKGAGAVATRFERRAGRTGRPRCIRKSAVPDAPGVQHASLRDRDDALHPQPRAQGHRPRHVDDPARLVHDEAQRRERDVSGVVGRVLAHASVRAGGSDRGLPADLRGARSRRCARSPASRRCRCSRTPARRASSPASR